MYLAEYDEGPQMHGFFKSLKKVVKKVTKPALHIGAAIATGGASLAVSAQMLARQKAQKAAQQQAAAEAAEFNRQADILRKLQTPAAPALPAPTPAPVQSAPVAAVAPAAAPVAPVTMTAPTANAVQAAVSQAQPPMPTSFTVPSFAPQPQYDMTFDDRRTVQPVRSDRPASALPSWAIPAGIGAAVLVGVMAMGRGRR